MRKGYKQTEIGIIPEDWDVSTCKNIIEKIIDNRGKTPPLASDGHPLIEANAIKDYSKSPDYSKVEKFVDQLTYTKWFRNGHPKQGDTLIVTVGSAGASAYVKEMKGCIAQNIIGIRVNSRCNNEFFYYYTKSRLFEKQVLAVLMGAVQPSLKAPHLNNFSLPLPPTLAEQEAIAEALSDADALIESLETLLAKKRQVKQGAMSELLMGKRRLVESGEWEEKSLLELAEGKKELFDDGDWIESEHITDEGIRLIQTGNIGVGKFLEREDKKYIYPSSFVSLRCKELREGDLLVCRLAEPAGRACVLPDIGEEKVITSVDVTIFRPPTTLANRVFLANVFSTNEWFRAVNDRSGGTTHKRISRGALGRMKIMLPPLPEQTAIAEILSDMDAEIRAVEEKLSKARAVKAGMMSALLGGRVRLV